MLGRTHTRYRQVYKGIEVDDRELIVHTKNGSVYEVNGEFLAGLALSVVPKTSVDGGTLVVWGTLVDDKFYFAATNKYGTEYCIYFGERQRRRPHQ